MVAHICILHNTHVLMSHTHQQQQHSRPHNANQHTFKSQRQHTLQQQPNRRNKNLYSDGIIYGKMAERKGANRAHNGISEIWLWI